MKLKSFAFQKLEVFISILSNRVVKKKNTIDFSGIQNDKKNLSFNN